MRNIADLVRTALSMIMGCVGMVAGMRGAEKGAGVGMRSLSGVNGVGVVAGLLHVFG